MTAVSFRVPGAVARSRNALITRARRAFAVAVAPHKASLARLLDMPLTVVGISLIDFGAFHYVHMIGWVVTGISLMVIEHMIADPDDGSP